MATERPRQIALGLVLVVLAFVLYRAWAAVGTTSVAPGSSPDRRARASKSAGAEASSSTAPDVRLETLNDERPHPVEGDRNLFRFKTATAPPAPAPPSQAVVRPVVPAGPTGPSGPPPIPLKFIGIVE